MCDDTRNYDQNKDMDQDQDQIYNGTRTEDLEPDRTIIFPLEQLAEEFHEYLSHPLYPKYVWDLSSKGENTFAYIDLLLYIISWIPK